MASFEQRLAIAEEDTEPYEGNLYCLIESGGQQEAMLKVWNERLQALRRGGESIRRWNDMKNREWSEFDAGIADICDEVGGFVLRIEIGHSLSEFYDRTVSLLADATMLDAGNIDSFLRAYGGTDSGAASGVSDALKRILAISHQANSAKRQCGTYPGAGKIEGVTFSNVGCADAISFRELMASRKELFRILECYSA